jgi:hypothetical protein
MTGTIPTENQRQPVVKEKVDRLEFEHKRREISEIIADVSPDGKYRN